MAPINFAVRSAFLHAAPSRNRRASSATNNPSVVIGITVAVTCAVLAIGTACFLIWRKRTRAAKEPEQSWERPSELEAKPEWEYRKICELQESEEVPPGYSASPQLAPYRATTLLEDNNSPGCPDQRILIPFQKAVQSHTRNLRRGGIERSPVSRISRQQIKNASTAAARSESSKEKECDTTQEVYPYYERTPLELPGNFPVSRVAPPNLRNSDLLERARHQNIIPTHVNPFEVELSPNSVYYPTSATPSNRLHTTSPREAYTPGTEPRQANENTSFDFGFPIPEMEMQPRVTFPDVVEILMRQPTPDSDSMLIDTEQGDAASPLITNLERYDSDEAMNVQIDQPEGSHHHGRVTTDEVSSDSRHLRAAGPVHTFDTEFSQKSSPRRRAAGSTLRPLDTENTDAESASSYNRMPKDRSRQRRRPNPRTLAPKSSPLGTSNTVSSPQSSRSTPDSARTEQSFASKITHSTSPNSSIITTQSLGAESPATPFTPSDNQLTCRDCGQVFNTPGQQKKHYNRQHNLRYVCDISNCLRPFGVRADLERHEHTVHADLFRSNKRSWCTVPGCPTPNKEWKRKDNFTRHVRSCEARAARVAGATGRSGKGKERALDIDCG